jgi:prolyl 4-hydroxylase
MISYIVGLVAILVVFGNPIQQLLFPGSAQPGRSIPRPHLNESLLALDGPNDTKPVCAPDAYAVRILNREPLVMYIENFLSQDERDHLLDIRSVPATPLSCLTIQKMERRPS